MEPTLVTQLAHLKIPLEKLREATKNFNEKNIIGKGGFGNMYKGQLIRFGKSIKIAARRLGRNQWQGEVEFWNEISMLYSFQDFGGVVVKLIGYCDEKGEKIIMYQRYPKGSLLMDISDPSTFYWEQRLEISYHVTGAIDAIQRIPRGYYIIHRNINSSTILVNRFDNIGLSGFEHSIKHSSDRKDQVLRCEAIGTQGYMDPTILKSGGVTHKSDIYSLGVVLYEVLCGRKANEDNKPLLAPLAKFHYENGTLEEIIHPDLWNQMNPESFKLFSEAAYSCLHEDRAQRPDALQLLSKLNRAVDLQNDPTQRPDKVEESEEDLTKETDRILKNVWPCLPKGKHLELFRIEFRDILFATKNLSDASHFDGHRDDLMKADLKLLNRECLLFVGGMNKDELPKKNYTVMIKSIEYLSKEVEILSSRNHENIESFLGFCEANLKTYIVSEFVSTNYLLFCLNDRILTWEKRLKICIDVARGLSYLHNEMKDQNMVIHRDINSRNIVLDNNWRAKIVEFGLAVFLPSNQLENALHVSINDFNSGVVLDYYVDPVYVKTGKLKRESDVFSFGAVMFEILSGMHVDDIMRTENQYGRDLTSLARRWFDEGIGKRKVTSMVKEENGENGYLLNKGLKEDSLDTFINVMYQCVAQKQNQRPPMEDVVKELEKALSLQENNKDTLRMSFQYIKSATQNFSNRIGGGGFGGVFKGEVAHENDSGYNTIVAKKLDKSLGQGEKQFYNELEILYEYKHENLIGLVGYSNETDEKIIIYEHAPNGSLDKHLDDPRLTWLKRLKICADIAVGLDFLHGGVAGQQVMIHRDIKTANILLFDDWKAKLGDFGLSLIITINKDPDYAIDRACGTEGYVDPLYLKSGLLTIESDIYSFGVVMFEILCGRTAYAILKHYSQSPYSFIKHNIEEGRQYDMVFEAIKEEIV